MTSDEQDPSTGPVEQSGASHLPVEPTEHAAVPSSPAAGPGNEPGHDVRPTPVGPAEVDGTPADFPFGDPEPSREEPSSVAVDAPRQQSPGTDPAAVEEPMSAPEPASAVEPVSDAEPVGATGPVSDAEPVGATGPVSDAEPVGATEPVSEVEPASDVAPASDGADGGRPEEVGADDDGSPGSAPPTLRRRSRPVAVAVGALVAVAAVIAGVLVWAPWQDGLPDDAAFRAAQTVVTENDVQRRTEVLRALYGVQVPEEAGLLDRFRRDTAKAMAISLVLDRAVAEADIRVADKAVSDALDRFLEQRYPQGGRAAYVQALSAEGVGEQDVLDEIRRQLEIARLFEQVTKDVEVTDEELRELFEADPAAYAVPERRRLRHVVLADQAAAQAALGRLQAGEDFAAVAGQVSLDGSTKDAGGDLGVAAARDLDPRFADAAFAVPKGQVFGPVQTSLGWHVGRVDEVLPGEPTTFDEVRAQLREQQETERRVAVWQQFIAARVEDADVVYADRYRPQDPLPDLTDAPVTGPAPASSASATPP